MKSTIATLFSIAIALAVVGMLAGTASGQGRHDDRPHGYEPSSGPKQAAASRMARTISLGPRGHDNRLIARTVGDGAAEHKVRQPAPPAPAK